MLECYHWVIFLLITAILILGDLTDLGELFEKKTIRAIRWWKRFKARLKRELQDETRDS